MTLTALFEGNSPSDLATAQTLASGLIGGVSIFTGQASWQDYTGSVGWEEGLWSGFHGTKLWSIPLFANGSNLHDAAQGAYDGYYADVAKTLAAGQGSGTIYVRTGWEFNGSWEAWSAKGKETDFIGAFRQFVDTFRSVSNRFVFTWAPSIGDQGMNPETAYPGDKYVDIIGEDFYWNTQWTSSNPETAWSSMVNQTYGLQWTETFAAAHGKPTAYPEWGVMTSNAAPYIAEAAKWFASHDVVYQSYWDSNADFPGKISDGSKPDVGAAYLAAFITPALVSHPLGDASAGVTQTAPAVGASTTTVVTSTSNGGVDASHATTGASTGGAVSPTAAIPTSTSMPASVTSSSASSTTSAGAASTSVTTPVTTLTTTAAGLVGDADVNTMRWVSVIPTYAPGQNLA